MRCSRRESFITFVCPSCLEKSKIDYYELIVLFDGGMYFFELSFIYKVCFINRLVVWKSVLSSVQYFILYYN